MKADLKYIFYFNIFKRGNSILTRCLNFFDLVFEMCGEWRKGYIYIYIYIYREREGDGERRRNIDRGRVCEGRERERGREIRDEEKGFQRE